MRRVLITGITGYIGSNLARNLPADCRIYGLVREPVRTDYIADIQDRLHLLPFDGSYESMEAALREVRPELVYHLATYYTGAHGGKETPQLIASNITMGAYLLEAMAAVGCTALVYASTVMAHYGGAAYRPLNLYAATKQAFSNLVEFYTSTGLLNAAALVLSDTYGPEDRRPKVLNLIRRAVLDKTPLDLTSGRQIFDAVYIDDVVRGLVQTAAALERTNTVHLRFQLSGADPRSLRDTVDLMLRVNGLTLQANWGGRPDPEHLDETPIRIYPAPPDWEPQILLEDGLRRFWGGASSD